MKHNDPSSRAAQKKARQETAVKPQAKRVDNKPAGRCRCAVRLFRASISASSRRLNAIAADRAATIATAIQKKRQPSPSISNPLSRQARRAPVKAKGSANTECSNFIMSSVSRRRLQKRLIGVAATILGDTVRGAAASN